MQRNFEPLKQRINEWQTREVSADQSTTKVNFTSVLRQSGVDIRLGRRLARLNLQDGKVTGHHMFEFKRQ